MNNSYFYFMFVLLLVSIQVQADTISKADLAICASESNSVKRLNCFDDLAKQVGASEPEVSIVESTGNWILKEEVSPLDDSKNIYLIVIANESIQNRYGKSITPELRIRCKENTTALNVWWGVYLGLDSTYVTHRIDKAASKRTKWSLSTKNEHTGKWDGNTSIPFIKSLFGKSNLLMQVTPYGENSVMTTFDVSGLENAIKSLRKQCGW